MKNNILQSFKILTIVKSSFQQQCSALFRWNNKWGLIKISTLYSFVPGGCSSPGSDRQSHQKVWTSKSDLNCFCGFLASAARQLQLVEQQLDRVGLRPQKSVNPASDQNVTFDPSPNYDQSSPPLWFCTHSLMNKNNNAMSTGNMGR